MILLSMLVTIALALTPSPPKLMIRAQIADKVSQFMILGEGSNMKLTFQNSEGLSSVRALQPRDYDFLVKEIEKLPVAKKIPSECARYHVDITLFRAGKEPLGKSSCLAIRTITEPAYARFLNILAMSF